MRRTRRRYNYVNIILILKKIRDAIRYDNIVFNCKIEGKVVNIEMQGLNKDNHFGRRAEYHVAHLYNHYVTKGLDWKETPKDFQISVLNFLLTNLRKTVSVII